MIRRAAPLAVALRCLLGCCAGANNRQFGNDRFATVPLDDDVNLLQVKHVTSRQLSNNTDDSQKAVAGETTNDEKSGSKCSCVMDETAIRSLIQTELHLRDVEIAKLKIALGTRSRGADATLRAFRNHSAEGEDIVVSAERKPENSLVQIGGKKRIFRKAMRAAKKGAQAWKKPINDLKKYLLKKVTSLGDKLKGLVSEVSDGLKKVANTVKNIYNKYIKPIVALIGECIKDAKSPVHFFTCLAQPVIEKLMKLLMPAGSVAKAVPFPADEAKLVYRPEILAYMSVTDCVDCGFTVRDFAPTDCIDREHNLGLFSFKARFCNIPFLPGGGGSGQKKKSDSSPADLFNSLRNLAIDCRERAYFQRDGSVVRRMSDTTEAIVAATLQSTNVTASLRSRHKTVGWLQEMLSLSIKMKVKGIDALRQFGDVNAHSPPKMSWLKENFEVMMATCAEIPPAWETGEAWVKAESEDLRNTWQALIDACAEADSIQGDPGRSVFEQVDADTQSILGMSDDQKGSIPGFLAACHRAKWPYMKAYFELSMLGIAVGRLKIAGNTGIKFAYLQPNNRVTMHDFTWDELQDEGQTFDLCFGVSCCSLRLQLRTNPESILGIPISIGGWLGDTVKFLSLSLVGFKWTLRPIGVPFEFSPPGDFESIFPPLTLPYILDDTLHSALDAAASPFTKADYEASIDRVIAEQGDDTEEASSIENGLHSDPNCTGECQELEGEVGNNSQDCNQAEELARIENQLAEKLQNLLGTWALRSVASNQFLGIPQSNEQAGEAVVLSSELDEGAQWIIEQPESKEADGVILIKNSMTDGYLYVTRQYDDQWCEYGVRDGPHCCAASCGVCGADDCEARPGGHSSCCKYGLLRQCFSSMDTACLIPPGDLPLLPLIHWHEQGIEASWFEKDVDEEWCRSGVKAEAEPFCCPTSCGTCGGPGCSDQCCPHTYTSMCSVSTDVKCRIPARMVTLTSALANQSARVRQRSGRELFPLESMSAGQTTCNCHDPENDGIVRGSAGRPLTAMPNRQWPGTCSHTLEEARPSWWVNLSVGGANSASFFVSSVELSSRAGFDHRLSGTDVYVDGTLCESNIQVPASGTVTISCVAVGSSVVVVREGTGYIQVCGFKAFGSQLVPYDSMVATQTGVAHGWTADRALALEPAWATESDSNRQVRTCQHTEGAILDGQSHWWQVSLGGTWQVTSVRLSSTMHFGTGYIDILVDSTVCASRVYVTRQSTATFPCIGIGTTIRVRRYDGPVHMCSFAAFGAQMENEPVYLGREESQEYSHIAASAHSKWSLERVAITLRNHQSNLYFCMNPLGKATETSVDLSTYCYWNLEYEGEAEDGVVTIKSYNNGKYVFIGAESALDYVRMHTRPIMDDSKSAGSEWILDVAEEVEGGGYRLASKRTETAGAGKMLLHIAEGATQYGLPVTLDSAEHTNSLSNIWNIDIAV
jgi:hypothetical protein